ncbi:MAG TPA: M28 family peptidase [Thermoanaerobaculia bacterium]|nr:M28 family peptidase [Thermoanaerobaculia bacterium]
MPAPRPLAALALLPLALSFAACASSRPVGRPADPTVPPAASAGEAALAGFAPSRRAAQQVAEASLRGAVDPTRLRSWHDLLSSRPHVAGSPGDRAVIDALAREMAAMGLEIEVQELELYLPRPVRAELTVVAPERVPLELQESAFAEDPWSGHPELDFGWNAYSGSGTAEAGVVYANYGTKEDFARLAELDVEVHGRIVVARYGRNFRGYKALFAERAGAAGLVIYSDPEDAGYVRGRMWPAGGWANGTAIQRGSVLTLPYPGDPLTPFAAALAGDGAVERLDPATVAFPTIPVQPIGWQAASEILSRMGGPAVPEEWQGALPFNYRLGGDELRLRLRVEQERRLVRTANVVGTLPGARFPEELVIVGCHHDAWSFGAGDPNAGSILVLEAARVFAEAARAGRRPDRSIVFAHWGAEEFGILGSVEWVEAHAARLAENAVAYVNLDMAAMGPRFRASATPSLAGLVVAASREVEQAGRPGVGVYEAWADGDELRVGALGGGSDHVGFYGHLGVPSISLGGGGSPGVSYHTNYENLAWYRQVVGDDYEPARMLTDVVVTVLSRLAAADLVPLAPGAYGAEAARRLEELAERWREESEEPAPVAALAALSDRAGAVAERADRARRRAEAALAAGRLDAAALAAAHRQLVAADRAWVDRDGLAGRPWYRNLFAAPDADSGYSSWVLPGLVAAVESGDATAVESAAERYGAALDRLGAAVSALEQIVETPGGAPR